MRLMDGWFINLNGNAYAIVNGSVVGEVEVEGSALAELGPGYYDLDLIKVPDAEATAPEQE